MADKSTIFIPDISGYTKFMSQTPLDHNAAILSNLLECIIDNNNLDFTVSEVEGDAVLLYKIGPPIERKILMDHCLSLYKIFHQQKAVMEAQRKCNCEACDGLAHLTLKFVIHYGEIKEVQIAHFKKASGIDMIIAHRLLKNNIDTNEYILASQDYLKHFNNQNDRLDLDWVQSSETYANLGTIDFEYANIH